MSEENLYGNLHDLGIPSRDRKEQEENSSYFTNDDNDFDLEAVQVQPVLDINDYVKKTEMEMHNGGNFPSMPEATKYILTLGEFFERNPSLLNIETGIMTKLVAPSQDFFLSALRKFDATRSMLFSFESLDDKSRYFAWRYKNEQQFCCLQISQSESEISEFIKKFLFTSLKHGHNALHTSFANDKDVVKVDVNFHNLGDARDFNLFAMACLSGDIVAVRFCLKNEFDVNLEVKGQTPIDLAYNARNLSVVLELLRANSQFPEGFEPTEASDELRSFISMTNDMHDSIIRSDIESVNKIIDENPYLRHFYDLQNNSAMTCMMAHEKFNVYETFVSKNIFFGPKENIDGVLSRVSVFRMKLLNKINQKLDKDPLQKHIQILLANSSVGFEAENNIEKLNRVVRVFSLLNQNHLISPMLKVVAASRKFQIIFDFSRESFRHIRVQDESYKNGLYAYSGKVQIAAKFLYKFDKEKLVLGALAHELCHFAMVIMFQNSGCPYSSDDAVTSAGFHTILDECKSKQDSRELMTLIFQRYPSDMQPAELVAAVPHMLAQHHDQDNALADIRTPYANLFYFYQERMISEMKKRVRSIENGASIKKEYLIVIKDYPKLKKGLYGLIGFFLIMAIALGICVFSYNKTFKIVDLSIDIPEGNSVGSTIKCVYSDENSEYRCCTFNINWRYLSQTKIVDVTGDHDGTRTNDDVNRFCIKNNTVVSFPQGLADFFPNLEAIYIIEVGMRQIPEDSLKGLKKLLSLYLNDNKLIFIESKLFSYTANLRRVDLSKNKIFKIFPHTFDNTALASLWLDSNDCYKKDIIAKSSSMELLLDKVMVECSCDHFSNNKCFDTDKDKQTSVMVGISIIAFLMISLLVAMIAIYCIFFRQTTNVVHEKNEDDDHMEMKEFA